MSNLKPYLSPPKSKAIHIDPTTSQHVISQSSSDLETRDQFALMQPIA